MVAPLGAGRAILASQDRGSALSAFRSAFAARQSRQVSMATVGDSILEGLGLSAMSDTVCSRLRDMVRSDYPVSDVVGGGFQNYLPAYYVGTGAALTTTEPVLTAGVTLNTFWGLGKRSALLPSTTTTDTITFTLTGVSGFKVSVAKTAAAVMGVQVNGGTVQNVSLVQTNAGGFVAYDSGVLTKGDYTVVISRISGGTVLCEGIFSYDGDTSSGFRTLDGGCSGASAASFATSGWQQASKAESFDLVICNLMTNDYLNSSSLPSVVTTNLNTIRSSLRVYNTKPDCWIYLVMPQPKHSGTPLAPWSEYIAAMKDAAAADPLGRSAVLDLSSMVPSWLGTTYSMVQVDQIHPNAKGASWIAANIEAFMLRGKMVAPS